MATSDALDGYERRRRNIRNQILDATASLIQSGGDTDMTVREIASSAGVSPATPFNHFKSKDGIFNALVARSMSDIYGDTVKEPETVMEGFLDITNYYISKQDVYKPVFKVILQAIPPRSRTLRTALEGIKRRIEIQIERGQLSSDAAPAILAEQLETFWFGTVILWSGDTISSDEWRIRVELGVELMLSAFYPKAARADASRRLAKLQKRASPILNSLPTSKSTPTSGNAS
ncbi:MAG: TetR/AcrR family transcriptional regulator [Hyphomonas sp.]